MTEAKMPDRKWFVLQVESSYEKIVSELLSEAGYEVFLPMYTKHYVMRGQRKSIQLPLFSRYLFCRLTPDVKASIISLKIPLKFLGFNHGLGCIDDAEIQTLKLVVEHFNCEPYKGFAVGDRVRIFTGALSGVEGVLIRESAGARLVISVSLLQRSVSIAIDSDQVERVLQQPLFPSTLSPGV